MIRDINIAINAAHPELPLVEATTFVGSPSSVFVRGVPKSCGNWRITAVSVAVTYPDNTTTTRVAMESAQGVWVATIPGTATSGRTIGGFRILADGEDENGAAVTGYVLGFADFAVFSMLPVPAPGETFYIFRYFDAQPATPKKGDAAIIGGVLKYYNGTAWTPFADLSDYKPKQTAVPDPTASGTATAFIDAITQDANGVITPTKKALPEATTSNKGIVQLDTALTASGKAADAKATGDALAGKVPTTRTVNSKALSSDVTLTGADIAVSGTDATKVAAALTMLNDNIGITVYHSGKVYTDADLVITRGALYKCVIVESSSTWVDAEWEKLFDLVPLAPLASPAFSGTPTAPTPTAGDSSTKVATTAFVQGAVPYALVTKTVTNGAVSLDDRASNSVTISTTLSPNTLTINFPTAPTGKLRDFAMRLNIAAGVTAPEIAWPQGVTLENNGGEVPEIADGETGGSSTILYFSETENNGTTAKFLVKSETLAAITQA